MVVRRHRSLRHGAPKLHYEIVAKLNKNARPSCRKPVLALQDAQEAVQHHHGHADALNPSAVTDMGTGDLPGRVFVQERSDHELCRDAGVHDGRGRSDPPPRGARRDGRGCIILAAGEKAFRDTTGRGTAKRGGV